MSKYYSANEIFSPESGMERLAPTFAQTRFDSHPPYKKYIGPIDYKTRQPSYKPNMAAVEIYNLANRLSGYDDNPILKGMSSQRLIDNETTNYGHSEPRMMRAALDALIKQDKLPQNELELPSSLSRDPRREEREINGNLVRNPTPYRRYLEGTGRLLNALSEAPMCVGKGCSRFMQAISPQGSRLGHMLPPNEFDKRDLEYKMQDVMENELGPAYRKYMEQKAWNPEIVNTYSNPRGKFGFNPITEEASNPYSPENIFTTQTNTNPYRIDYPSSPLGSSNIVQQYPSPIKSPGSPGSPFPHSPIYPEFLTPPSASSSSSSSRSSPEYNGPMTDTRAVTYAQRREMNKVGRETYDIPSSFSLPSSSSSSDYDIAPTNLLSQFNKYG